MDELFRLAVVRASDRPAADTVPLEPDLDLVRQLAATEADWVAKQAIAAAFLDSGRAIKTLSDAPLYAPLTALGAALRKDQKIHGPALQQLVNKTVPPPHTQIEDDLFRLSGNFLCLYIAPRPDRPSLPQFAELLRLLWLVIRVDRHDPGLDVAGIVPALLSATVMVPPQVFTVPRNQVFPIGIADLVLVKQHIFGYELGEIATIENILRGESRTHTQKHSLTNERSTTIETETIKETDKELTTKDTVNLRNEVSNTLKEDLKINAGVSLKYGGDSGPYHVETNLNFAYDRASEQASKSAQELAKDVTQKSASKLTERIKEVLQTKVTETLEELQDQNFDNAKGTSNISGIYQWVEKVYTAQMFNYGKRVLFDLTVPEPAAFLIQAAKDASKKDTPTSPPPLTLSGKIDDPNHPNPANRDLLPTDLTDLATDPATGASNSGFYGHFVSRYKVPDVTPPPAQHVTAAKTVAVRETSDGADITAGDTIQLPDGYAATKFSIQAVYYHRGDKPPFVGVTVGNQPPVAFINNSLNGVTVAGPYSNDEYTGTYATLPSTAMGETQVEVGVQTAFVRMAAVGIEVTAERTADLYAKWQLETYGKIAARWQKLQDDYEARVAAQQFTPPITPLGRDPVTNRMTEQTELKRSCLALLRAEYLGSFNDIHGVPIPDGTTQPPLVPFPDLTKAEKDGAVVRFFEQAFEWENIGYVFYPYFWGRPQGWSTALTMANPDPLFELFLKAGYARVVVPVRPSFNDAVQYFLTTNQVWGGGSLPAVSDPTYLPIAEEIKNQEGAPGNETPQGDPWKFRLPADLIKLRGDDTLPSWHWVGHAEASDGNWSWTDKLAPSQATDAQATPAAAVPAGSPRPLPAGPLPTSAATLPVDDDTGQDAAGDAARTLLVDGD